MGGERRVRLTEGDSVEHGLRCPECGTYTALADIIATSRCREAMSGGDCDVRLHVDVVVEG